MARRVFFSFHYEQDVWRAGIVRNSHVVVGTATAGFHDSSLWEEAKRRGDRAIQRLVDDALQRTTVTVVLIGAGTARRRWVRYEIAASHARGNGLLGIYIDQLPDQFGRKGVRGKVPAALADLSAPCYVWNPARFGAWVESVAVSAGHRPSG